MDGKRLLVLALLFALATAVEPLLAVPPPIGLACPLLALGLALGGTWGRAILVLAGGLLLGRLSAPEPANLTVGRVVEATGRICGSWVPRIAGRSAPLCADLLVQGRRVTVGDLRLRIDLDSPCPPPAPGSRVRVRGIVSRSTGFANEHYVAPGPWRLRVKSPVFLELLAPPSAPARTVATLRRTVRSLFEAPQRVERPGIGLARALLLGDPEGLSERSQLALRRTGLAHLIAVSGFNVSLVAILAAAGGSSSSRRLQLALVSISVSLYVAAVGTSPSVLRAFGMALLALAALSLGRAPQARHSLACVLFALVVAEPAMLREPGFQLSFAATAGLLLLTSRWSERLEWAFPRPLAVALAASLAAQAAALPFSVATFGEIPPAAPLLNLLAVPWAGICLALAFAWTTLAMVAAAPADTLLPILDWAAAPLAALAELPASPLISVVWTGGWIQSLVPAAALVAIGEGGAVLRVAFLTSLLLLQTGGRAASGTEVEVLFVDVGQGDATLLHAEGRAVLVDAGGAPRANLGARLLRPVLASRGISRLEAAIVTHADLDHCQGLVDLAAYVPIDALWAPVGAQEAPCVTALAEATGLEARLLAAGDRESVAGFAFVVLNPGRDPGASSGNAASLVLAVEAAERRLLLTADIDADSERRLAATFGSALRADLLKVSHHGSAGSSSAEFLDAVKPRLAVISAGGGNPYGHPAPEAVARLRSAGARVLRTDRDGAVGVRWTRNGPWRIALPGSPRSRSPGR